VCKINLKTDLDGALCPKVRSLCVSNDNKKILVGTFGSEIYELSTNDSSFSNTTKWEH